MGTASGSVALAHVVPHVYYNGSYPLEPLTDASVGLFTVVVTVYFVAPAAASGVLHVSGAWAGASVSQPVSLPSGSSSVAVALLAPPGSVSLWWPNGLGAHPLYNVTVAFTPTAPPSAPVSATRAIGFRVFTLVTANDTDPSSLSGVDGSGDLTMRWNVNGAKIWSRGANLIPMDEMEGRLSVAAYESMMQSAADAGYNTLRVWGGGIYLHDIVYDTADALGLMMYHDVMYGMAWFGGNSGVPVNNAMQDAEMRHQLRRLSHHPCIVQWDAWFVCRSHVVGVLHSFDSIWHQHVPPSHKAKPLLISFDSVRYQYPFFAMFILAAMNVVAWAFGAPSSRLSSPPRTPRGQFGQVCQQRHRGRWFS